SRNAPGPFAAGRLFLFLALCLSPRLLYAQTAAEIDTLLAAPQVSYAQSARFVLEAAEKLPITPLAGTKAEQTAFSLAREKGWLPPSAAQDDPAILGDLSLLIMKAFQLKGGIMYSLFPLPRYACRELAAKKIIQGRDDPNLTVSGTQLLHLVSRVLSREPGHE
ncbi:MAG: hypothetical protein LBT39_04765, partial [Treponema sp.]|nr:hypothetical protein [Treponema sp.]